jgi:hypothetical protein
MKQLLVDICLKFMSMDFVTKLVAKCIAKLLELARQKGDAYWDTAKASIKEIKMWCEIFDSVYADDTLTEEEEIEIQDAIKNSNVTNAILERLNKTE